MSNEPGDDCFDCSGVQLEQGRGTPDQRPAYLWPLHRTCAQQTHGGESYSHTVPVSSSWIMLWSQRKRHRYVNCFGNVNTYIKKFRNISIILSVLSKHIKLMPRFQLNFLDCFLRLLPEYLIFISEDWTLITTNWSHTLTGGCWASVKSRLLDYSNVRLNISGKFYIYFLSVILINVEWSLKHQLHGMWQAALERIKPCPRQRSVCYLSPNITNTNKFRDEWKQTDKTHWSSQH